MKLTQMVIEEKGNIMVIVLLMLVVASLSGITMMDDSIIERQMAANHQFYSMAFHFADSGINVTPMLIEAFYTEDFSGDEKTGVSVNYEGGTETLFKEEALAMNIDPGDFETGSDLAVMYFDMDDDYSVTNKLDFRDRVQAWGSESGTCFYFHYLLNSSAVGPRNAMSSVSGVYRRVLN